MNFLSSSTPPLVDDVIVQGDSYLFVFEVDDYTNDLWSGQLTFALLGSAPIIVPATVGGSLVLYNALLDSASSLLLPIGMVDSYLILTQITGTPPQRVSLYLGSVTIEPNPLVAYVPTTPNQKALAAVNNTINTILSQPESSASFNGQSYTLHNIKDLFDIRNSLQVQVSGELRAMGLVVKPTARIIQNRFV
jgi:hypothetical protein